MDCVNKPNRELSDNEFCVLCALSIKPMYGYILKQEIYRITNGKKNLSLATLYDVLRKLFDDGFIERHEDTQIVEGRVRRSYRITPEGKSSLREKETSLECLLKINSLTALREGA